MNQRSENPFESIESAQDFVTLLSEALAETMNDIDADVQRESSNPSRRLEAMRIASYHLHNLEFHLIRSRRILNDLRSLRRLLFQERTISPAVVEPIAVPPEVAENMAPVITPLPETSHLESRRVRAIAA